MRTLKNLIIRYMCRIMCVLAILILFMLVYIQVVTEQRGAREDAQRIFAQIESILEENQKEIAEIQAEYRQTCLKNAELAALVIEERPELLADVEGLREIAALVEVDEIHVFDTAGRIFTGTHPQYYDYTFDSGEQMRFFAPMLMDRSLKLVQEITPNTAEGKPMQYSAVWSRNGEFIVQVGMEPINVTKVTQKNEISHVFSLLGVDSEVDYYAVDAVSGEIVGSTALEKIGAKASEIGLDFADIRAEDTWEFHAKINGELAFCVFQRIGENDIGRVVGVRNLYRRIPVMLPWMFLSLLLIVSCMAKAVVQYMNTYVVEKISAVNTKLKSIADGNLEETVDIQSSVEFAELSNYLNSMIKSLLDNSKKMSYVLSRTYMHIGTYEYSSYTKRVHYTEDIPQILHVDAERMKELAQDWQRFCACLNEVREHPLPEEQGVYRLGEAYIRLGEIENSDGVFGVAIDVTAEVTKRKQIERERDLDALTGLYNRSGLERRLEQLPREAKELGNSAIFMVDADGLKKINDTYGHEKGDIYLKSLGELLTGIGTKGRIVSRLGGDEFVLFLYGYENAEELAGAVAQLREKQASSRVTLGEAITVPLLFSFGYCPIRGEVDYQTLLKEADEKMYQNKAERRKLLKNRKRE